MSSWLHFAVPLLLEISALSAAIYCVYRAQKNRIYPAFWQLLIFWASSDALMFAEGLVRHLHLVTGAQFYYVYAFTYWPCFLINAILMLRVLHEMFRHAVRSIPGVQKLGRPVFFWAMVVSLILTAAAGTSFHFGGMDFLLASGQVMMRSEAVLALCMLTFLAFASNTLGVSYRSRIFGVIFGFGLMATANLMTAAFMAHFGNSVASGANVAFEMVNFAAIAIWGAYFLKPEPARLLVAVPVTSPMMRWNDIAQTLGNPAGQVAVSYPPSFMRDVTELVENVMGPAGWPRQAAADGPQGPAAS